MIRNGLHSNINGMDEKKNKQAPEYYRSDETLYYPFSYNTLFDWDNDFRTRIYRMPFITQHEAYITMHSKERKKKVIVDWIIFRHIVSYLSWQTQLS